jgi:prevent-host-death family protein
MPDPEVDRKETTVTDAAVSEMAVDAVDFRRNLGDYLGRAGYGHDRVIVSKNGRETAALIGPRDLERLRSLDRPAAE